MEVECYASEELDPCEATILLTSSSNPSDTWRIDPCQARTILHEFTNTIESDEMATQID